DRVRRREQPALAAPARGSESGLARQRRCEWLGELRRVRLVDLRRPSILAEAPEKGRARKVAKGREAIELPLRVRYGPLAKPSGNGRFCAFETWSDVSCRRQAEWERAWRLSKKSVPDWPRSGRSSRAAFSLARRRQ